MLYLINLLRLGNYQAEFAKPMISEANWLSAMHATPFHCREAGIHHWQFFS
jgi:hypothetical protein